MTIEAFVQASRDQTAQREYAWPYILRECEKNGYFTIPASLVESFESNVVVTVHGYPDPRENEKTRMHRHDFLN